MVHSMLVDSSIWLEIFLGGDLKNLCKKVLNSESSVSVLSYLEVYKKLKLKFSEQAALEAIGSLGQYPCIEINQEVALLAGDLATEFNTP
jgi:hypothetical protein